MGIWWYLTVVLISIPLRSNDMGHLFRYPFVYCEVSKFFVHFLLYCVFSFYWVVILCIFFMVRTFCVLSKKENNKDCFIHVFLYKFYNFSFYYNCYLWYEIKISFIFLYKYPITLASLLENLLCLSFNYIGPFTKINWSYVCWAFSGISILYYLVTYLCFHCTVLTHYPS